MSDKLGKDSLRRDAKAIQAILSVGKDRRVITKQNIVIHIPSRFEQIGLAKIGAQTFVYGCFPIITENGTYSLFHVNSLIEVVPTRIRKIDIADVEYLQMEFDAGSTFIKTVDLVKRDTMMFTVLDEFIFKGKIPWYMSYDDVGSMFSTAEKYAGSKVGANSGSVEFLASLIARSYEDPSQLIRHKQDSLKKGTGNIQFVPLSSVYWSVNNTVNKLAGSYFNDGVVGALVNPTTEPSAIETILRS